MNSHTNSARWLGAAFLLQAVASAVSYLILRDPLIEPGSIVATMSNLSANAFQMRASIVIEMITVIGIVMLGSLLYLTLKRQNTRIALVAFGLYLLEVALLATSSLEAYSLLGISQESVRAGHPVFLQTLGSLSHAAMNSANELHMVPFAVGATLFYSLFLKSGFLPRWLSAFGIVAASLAVVGSALVLFNVAVPTIVFLPNLPFELGVGIWLVFRGIGDDSEADKPIHPGDSGESNQ